MTNKKKKRKKKKRGEARERNRMKRGGGDRSWGRREGEEVFGCQALRVCGRHEKERREGE